MQIFIGSTKIMVAPSNNRLDLATEPIFKQQAHDLAVQLSELKTDEIKSLLKVNNEIATETHKRYQSFFDKETRHPAMFTYNGMVFKKLASETLTNEDVNYAQSHLIIGSFIYGMLRPLDLISPYRMEGNVILPYNHGKNMFQYWQPILTEWFINRIKSDDGILVNLASAEFKHLVDWKLVSKEVKIITPEFYVIKNGKKKMIVIYAKMCRGAMTHWILEKRITSPDSLMNFEYEGFSFDNDNKQWLLK